MIPADDKTLESYRREIDITDKEIVRLLLHRTTQAALIGEQKRKNQQPVYRPDRERDVYQNISKYAKEYSNSPPLSDEVLFNIYREIISASISVERGPAISFLGPEASFSHIACRSRFGSSLREIPVGSISEVFRNVESGRDATYGIVPVDNTTEGSVGPTMDMLLQTDLKIYAELYIRVDHYLLYHQEMSPEGLKRLYTNKIVMEQCRAWLERNVPLNRIDVVETPSTAAAARLAAERKDGGAIASRMAADRYKLSIIGSQIQDSSRNLTRFFVMGNDQCPPTGDDKTSIIVSLLDSPGSLVKMLHPFYDATINLTRIESRSSRRSYGDYNFFIDFIGHCDEPEIKRILKSLVANSSSLKILGSYPRADQP